MAGEDDERRLWFRREVLPLEPRLRRHAARLVRTTPDEAEDLVHETLAKLIGYAGWREIDKVEAFALTVLKNQMLQAARRRKIVPIHALSDHDAMQITDDAPGQERILEARDELTLLSRLVEQLPAQCRRVFKLRKVYGLSQAEVADQLGLSISTVEKHMVKGLRLCSEGLARGGTQAGARERDGSKHGNTARADQGGSGRLGRSPRRL